MGRSRGWKLFVGRGGRKCGKCEPSCELVEVGRGKAELQALGVGVAVV